MCLVMSDAGSLLHIIIIQSVLNHKRDTLSKYLAANCDAGSYRGAGVL